MGKEEGEGGRGKGGDRGVGRGGVREFNYFPRGEDGSASVGHTADNDRKSFRTLPPLPHPPPPPDGRTFGCQQWSIVPAATAASVTGIATSATIPVSPAPLPQPPLRYLRPPRPPHPHPLPSVRYRRRHLRYDTTAAATASAIATTRASSFSPPTHPPSLRTRQTRPAEDRTPHF